MYRYTNYNFLNKNNEGQRHFDDYFTKKHFTATERFLFLRTAGHLRQLSRQRVLVILGQIFVCCCLVTIGTLWQLRFDTRVLKIKNNQLLSPEPPEKCSQHHNTGTFVF